ncbi:MAG: hypothetical protein WCO52_05740 [bacterium]
MNKNGPVLSTLFFISVCLSAGSYLIKSYDTFSCTDVIDLSRPTLTCKDTLRGWPVTYYYSNLEGQDLALRGYDSLNKPLPITMEFALNTCCYLVPLGLAYGLLIALKKKPAKAQ